MPTTVEGAFADIGEIAAKYGLTMRTVSHEAWREIGRRARRRGDQCPGALPVTVSSAARTAAPC